MVRFIALALVASLATGVAGTASAQHREDHDWRGGWHDRDIHRFHEHDIDVWRSGRWFQGRHGGRVGWWWVLGDAWYYYPQPIYPYPNPYLPPVAVAPPPGPPGQVYYYCPRPRGYYPYVQACAAHWRAVPGG
jgi:hypothetical protein